MIAALALAPACRSGLASPGEQQERAAIRVPDDLGRSVELPRPARRIASLSPALTEVLFAVGCGDRLVLRDPQSSYPAAVHRLPSASPFQLSPEHVSGYSPDLLLLSNVGGDQLRALDEIGLPTAVFDPRSLEDLYASVQRVAALCGAARRAVPLIDGLRARQARVARAVAGRPRPTVYVETDGSDFLRPWTAGPGSLVDSLLQLAGGSNFAARLGRPATQVSAEEILARQPEVILLLDLRGGLAGRGRALLAARPGWAALEAVRDGRVVDDIDPDLLSRPGPRSLAGLEALASRLHPSALP